MEDVNDLRRKYMDNPPEGYTSKEIERMSYEKGCKKTKKSFFTALFLFCAILS